MRLSWDKFKAFVDGRSVPVHEVELDDSNYMLTAIDGPIEHSCKLKNDDDVNSAYQDYITNYHTAANPSFTDSNGISLARTKITRSIAEYDSVCSICVRSI